MIPYVATARESFTLVYCNCVGRNDFKSILIARGMLDNASSTYVMCQNMYRAFQRSGLLLLVLTFHRLIMNAFLLVIAGLIRS
jgi:hypothetical protein